MPIFQVRKLKPGGVEGIVQPSQDSHPGLQTLCRAGKTFYRTSVEGEMQVGVFHLQNTQQPKTPLQRGALGTLWMLGRGFGQNETLAAQGASTGKEEFPRMHCR